MLLRTPTNRVRFKQEWFNPLYFHLRKYVDEPSIRKIMVYGGKSSAKTFSIGQLFANFTYTQSSSSICYRKEQTTIKTTLKPAIQKAISSIKFDAIFENYDFKIQCNTGHHIIFKGLDSEGKVKGIEGYRFLLFDELDHFTQEEWTQANLSLRGLPNQKLFATWNPVDERIWIKEELDAIDWVEMPLMIDNNPYSKLSSSSSVQLSKDGKTLLIKTNYFDNKWMIGGDGYGVRDENLIHEYEMLGRVNANWYRVNVLGEWGKAEVARPYCYNFDRNKHVSERAVFNPKLPVYAMIDFNVSPFPCSFAHIWTDKAGKHFHVFKSIVLNDGDVYKMCDKIKESFDRITLSGMYFTGDATQRKREITQRNNLNGWRIIQNELKISDTRLQVPRSNPSVRESRHLVNAVLSLHPDFIIHPSCSLLINECQYTEASEDGDIIKKNRSNENERADALDGLRYSISTWLFDFIETIRR